MLTKDLKLLSSDYEYVINFCVSLENVAEEINKHPTDVLRDANDGFLRLVKTKFGDWINKDWFYYEYINHRGDRSKLIPFGYAKTTGKKLFVCNNYIITLLKPDAKRKLYQANAYAPNSKVYFFVGKSAVEVIDKAVAFTFEHQVFGSYAMRIHTKNIILNKWEIQFLLGLLPNKGLQSLRSKLIFAVKRIQQNENKRKQNES